MGAEGRYTALGLLKGCKTDAGTGVVMWPAGEGMGLSAAGGIFLNTREEPKRNSETLGWHRWGGSMKSEHQGYREHPGRTRLWSMRPRGWKDLKDGPALCNPHSTSSI